MYYFITHEHTKMKTVHVRFDIELPDSATFEDVYEFLSSELGYRGGMSGENSLSNTDILSHKVTNLSIAKDKRQIRKEIEYQINHWKKQRDNLNSAIEETDLVLDGLYKSLHILTKQEESNG
jgi:hypothetical protein